MSKTGRAAYNYQQIDCNPQVVRTDNKEKSSALLAIWEGIHRLVIDSLQKNQ